MTLAPVAAARSIKNVVETFRVKRFPEENKGKATNGFNLTWRDAHD